MQKQVYKSRNHGHNLNNMRLNNKWCDVIVKVEGKEYPAHKNVLAANLTHFEAMFKNDSFQESQHGVALMEDMRAKDLEEFIVYAYTGELTLTDVSALNLLKLADYLREEEIREACIEFLGKHLRTEDAFRAYRWAAATGCRLLANTAKDVIMENFEGFLESPDYLDLEYENVKDILSDAEVKAIKAQQMFDGVMRWTGHDTENRKDHVDDLLISIDPRRLTTDYLMSYLYKNVTGRASGSEITMSVMSWYHNRDQDHQAKQRNQALMTMSWRKDKVRYQWFDFAQNKWSQAREASIASENASLLTEGNAAVVDDKLYFVNGSLKNVSLKVFDPMTKEIKTCHSMLLFSAVCSCSRFVYLCGGCDVNGSSSNQVLRYDPLTNSIEQLPSMRDKRFRAATVFHEGCLYVLGGCVGSSSLDSVEKYDPDTESWSSLASMSQPREFHAVAVLEGKLYACGGQGLKSVEVYEPRENRWKPVASMNKSRTWFVLIAHEGKLWAVGGGGNPSVEFYDPSKDQWQMNPEMSSGLAIKYPKGGLISRNCIGTE